MNSTILFVVFEVKIINLYNRDIVIIFLKIVNEIITITIPEFFFLLKLFCILKKELDFVPRIVQGFSHGIH
jgi:hypothetical protein